MDKTILKMVKKRAVQSLITILIVTFIVFCLMHAVPGDPIHNFLGSDASEEQIEYYTKLYGYDQPMIVQYFNWITGFLKGNMGFSIFYQQDVSEFIFQRVGVTLNVVLISFAISVVLGVVLGTIAALKRGKLADTVITFISNIGVSMPAFWIGIILIMVFALKLHWLPTSNFVPFSENPVKWAKHLVMPVTVLSFSPLASFARQTRSAMLEVINQDYVNTARAKGLKKRDIVMKHQLRNALIPIVTVMGSRLGGMLGGTVLVESVFVLPGLGDLMIIAIRNRDYMIVADGVMLIALFVALCNLAVDILYGIIDPRIRNR